MKKLLEDLEKNPEMKAKFEQLDQNPKSVPEDYIKVAAEYGIELTKEDFQPVKEQGEITDDELDAVAGGDECVCAVGGGGKASVYEKVCACVMGGSGDFTDKVHVIGSDSQNRCFCIMAGYGDTAK